MWDIILQNLPIAILFILAAIICGAELIKAIGVWKEAHQNRVDMRLNETAQEQETQTALTELHNTMLLILEKITTIEGRIGNAEERLDRLTVSDMHDIKAWIVDQYHKFYKEDLSISFYESYQFLLHHLSPEYPKYENNHSIYRHLIPLFQGLLQHLLWLQSFEKRHLTSLTYQLP